MTEESLVPASTLRCSVAIKQDEYIVTLVNDQTTHYFSVEQKECPPPYALFLALIDFLENHTVSSPMWIYVNDLFAYNVLNDYLKRWKSNGWLNSGGKPVPFVDILSDLYNALVNKSLAYRVLLDRTAVNS